MSAWRATISTFTIFPVGGGHDIGPRTARRMVLWLPVLGCVLGAMAAAAMTAVEMGGHAAPRRLLAATVAVVTLAALTGALHLDGLADTADGLFSRRRRDEALALMRRSDTGPMGVVALLLVVLTEVTALATLPADLLGAAAVVTAVAAGRVAVVLASGLPAARPEGFGTLIAGSTSRLVRLACAATLLAVVAAGASALGGPALAVRGLAAVVSGLFVAGLLARAALRRLGGVTGDVFGAVIETCTAVVLLTLAVGG